MFEAIIQADRLQAFVDALTCLVDEAKIHVDHDDGFRATAVDPANVAMVDAEIDVEAFESFDSGKGVVGINVGALDDIIDFASADDLVHLTWNQETRRLDIEIVTDEGEFAYDLALIDPDAIRKEPEIPDLSEELTERFAISGRQFDTAIDAVTLADDHVNIATELGDVQSAARFYADGDTDTSSWTFVEADCSLFDVNEAKTSMYSADYLTDMVRPIPKSADVTFRLGHEIPTKWEYEADEEVSVLNMLAPQIQAN